jgi:rhodanese-related sulfurtransferase
VAVTVGTLVAEAKSRIENLTPDEVAAELALGTATLVDLREEDERTRIGQIAGTIAAPRGMLEFWADPASPYHRSEFDPAARIILVCASGGRSALGANTLQMMGFGRVAHLDGGLKAWMASGRPVEVSDDRPGL